MTDRAQPPESVRCGRSRARDEKGQVLAFLVVVIVTLLAMAAFVVDIGYAYYVQRQLQASADAAATAGATNLPDASAAVSAAQQYSGSAGGKNTGNTPPGVTTTVTTKCLTIAPCRPVNAVVVEQTTQVKTFFARVIGIDTLNVRAKATACSPCSTRPADIMLVLDRTGSMCQDSNGNADPACTDLNNARAGLKAFLALMDPSFHKIGFAVFPPAPSGGSNCITPQTAFYDSTNSRYVLVPLSGDYLVGGVLNNSSALVSTINCQQGGGRTAYATAIEQAQAELDAHGRPDAPDVIVFFSDVAANIGPAYYGNSSPYRTQPCHQGVNSAAGVKARGTVIYSIGYDLNANGGGANVCTSYTGSLEQPPITAYQAIQQIASAPDTFYNQPGPGELVTIYTKIAADVLGTRLINDDTL